MKKEFSPSRFPSGQDFQFSFILFVAGVSLFFAPLFVPDLQSTSLYNSAVSSVERFELQDEINGGAFKESDRSGDTRPSWDATFRGISIRGANNVEGAKAFVGKAKDTLSKSIKDLHEGIFLMKKLGLLKLSDKTAVEKYYSSILALSESNSAFRLNSGRSASVAATYHAFKAIEELGKFSEFRNTEQYKSAVSFVVAQKEYGGYHDGHGIEGKNASIQATWHAIQILAKTDLNDTLKETYFGNLTNYVLRLQSPDGGYFNSLLDSRELAKTPSTVTTVQAIYIVEFLKAHGVSTLSITDSSSSRYKESFAYLRSCLSSSGVSSGALLPGHSLEATYYFDYLVKAYPDISYGTPREFQYFLFALSILSLVTAAFYFYKGQVPDQIISLVSKHVYTCLGFVFLGYFSFKLFPAFTLAAYLLYGFFLIIEAYKLQEAEDTNDNLMVLVASLSALVFLGSVFGFGLLNPVLFTQSYTFFTILILLGISTFAVTLGAIYFSKHKKMLLFVYAAYLSWIGSTVSLLSFLYGRGDGLVVQRFISIRGFLPVVILAVPYASLIISYAAAGAAIFVFHTSSFFKNLK